MRTHLVPAFLIVLLALGTVTLAGCGDTAKENGGSPGASGEKGTEGAKCSCDDAKAGDAGWCEKCGVGYIKGEKTKCEGCVKSALGGEPCADCAKKASEEEGDDEGGLLADATGAKSATGKAGSEGAAGSCGKKDADCECSKSGEAECVCLRGKAGEPLWCEKCDKGYVDGKPADCKCCVKKAQEALEKTDG